MRNRWGSVKIAANYFDNAPSQHTVVEMEGFEPSSKRGTNGLSTCLVLTWFSSAGRIKTTNLQLSL